MVKVLAITVGVVAAAFGALLAFSPRQYEVFREVTIAAPSAEVHAWVEDLRRWPDWTVWNTTNDPAIDYTYAGPEKGVDAHSSWTSTDGPGSLLITASDPLKGVWYDLSFGESDRALHSKGVLQYEAVEGGTRVRWTNAGRLEGFMPRMMGYGMEMFMGPPFEDGLDGLKTAVEGAARPAPAQHGT